MSSVQISPNSVLMSPPDVNPLANPSYQHPIHKIKELNSKAIEQLKTDTVTISQEAVAKSVELNSTEGSPREKASSEIIASSQSTQLPSRSLSDTTINDTASSSTDQVTISSEASMKSSILIALTEAASLNKPETTYDKLKP